MKLKKIGVLSCAKVYGIIGLIMGLILGILLALFGGMMSAASESGIMFVGMGFLGIIALPIFYGVVGFLAGAVTAWLYNLGAKWVGGIELEFEK